MYIVNKYTFKGQMAHAPPEVENCVLLNLSPCSNLWAAQVINTAMPHYGPFVKIKLLTLFLLAFLTHLLFTNINCYIN